jgi:hypothetical protein
MLFRRLVFPMTGVRNLVITTNEAFSILSGWQENSTDLEVVEFGGLESKFTRAHCVIVGVDRRAETVSVVYEPAPGRTEDHCFDLREAVFFFEPNAASHPKTALLVDFPSHMRIFFVEH